EGHGVAGMRERAAAVGGELRVGAAPGGGFAVEAGLPVTDES
ncbi:sensor histidine kinase, partial [Nonomuraea sp. NN258]|nr:sensor histidine kinase [Nonomuraea antri]